MKPLPNKIDLFAVRTGKSDFLIVQNAINAIIDYLSEATCTCHRCPSKSRHRMDYLEPMHPKKNLCEVSGQYGKDNNKNLHWYCEHCGLEMNYDEVRECGGKKKCCSNCGFNNEPREYGTSCEGCSCHKPLTLAEKMQTLKDSLVEQLEELDGSGINGDFGVAYELGYRKAAADAIAIIKNNTK